MMVVAHGGQQKVAVWTKKMMVVIKAPDLYQILTPKTHSPLVGFIPQRYHRIVSFTHGQANSIMSL